MIQLTARWRQTMGISGVVNVLTNPMKKPPVPRKARGLLHPSAINNITDNSTHYPENRALHIAAGMLSPRAAPFRYGWRNGPVLLPLVSMRNR